jgi:hypothetical protein
MTTSAAKSPGDPGHRLLALSARLAGLARQYEAKHDSRCVFTHAYSLMTERIASQLPRFASVDPDWIADLAEAFAGHYFDALDGSTASSAWAEAFKAMRDRRTSVIEDLVFAMSVHILHDLPLALGDVSPGRSPDRNRIADYHSVNDMLKDAIEPIVTTTARRYSPYIRWLDQLTHPFDQIVTDYGIRMARGLAWYNTLRLADPASVSRAQESIEKSPVVIIDGILNPPIHTLRAILRFLRWIVSFLRRWPKPTSTRGLQLPSNLS